MEYSYTDQILLFFRRYHFAYLYFVVYGSICLFYFKNGPSTLVSFGLMKCSWNRTGIMQNAVDLNLSYIDYVISVPNLLRTLSACYLTLFSLVLLISQNPTETDK